MTDLQEAERMGREAFAAGKSRAPALNQEFLNKYVAGNPIIGRGSKFMKAYLAGWDAAHSAFSIAFELKKKSN